MKKKHDRKVKMIFKGKTPRKIPGVGKVEPGSTFDFPERMSANLARDPLFDFATEGTENKNKHKTTKGTRDSKQKKNPPVHKEEMEVKDG